MLNQILGQSVSAAPVVGMGVTKLGYTDRTPYTIIEIISEKEIVVQEDNAVRTDANGMSECQRYTFSPNPNGHKVVLTLRRSGRWIEKGIPDKKGATQYMIGERMKYYDYSF